jgi:hypothetical protein
MPSSRQVARMPSSIPRLNSEYSICRPVIGLNRRAGRRSLEWSTAYSGGILELVYVPAPSVAPGGQALADAGDADE